MYLHLVCNRNVTQGFTAEKKKWNDDKRGGKGNQKTFWQFFYDFIHPQQQQQKITVEERTQ